MFGRTRDPVCRLKVKKSTPYRFNLQGRTFYFHGSACRQTFQDDPGRFVGGKKKGLITTLAEASDGQPKTCH
ncbi:MAG: YHS domain-containing protein [Candidatus Aerophobetes bacterium]